MNVASYKWIVIAWVAWMVSGCAGLPAPEVVFIEDFETSLDPWTAGSEVPQDPNDPGQPVAWSITRSSEQASSGARSARFQLDGRQGSGTIWLARSFEVEQEGTYRVHMLLDFWSPSASFNTLARTALYAGAEEPTERGDFDTSQAADLFAGWHTYAYARNVSVGPDGVAWVAFGISSVWEAELTYFIDNVIVSLVPLD